MDYEFATRKQLLQIALYEECPIEYKYAACRELQIRSWNETYLTDLVRLWGRGMSTFNISIELGVSENTVKWQLKKRNLIKNRVKGA